MGPTASKNRRLYRFARTRRGLEPTVVHIPQTFQLPTIPDAFEGYFSEMKT